MSKIRKAKKLRRPNVPMALGPTAAGGGGAETVEARRETESVQCDYTHIKKDLTRIAVLAGSFIAILVALSFFIK
jgi:hypothetical protein